MSDAVRRAEDELRVALLDAFRTPGEMKIVVDYADLSVSFVNFLAGKARPTITPCSPFFNGWMRRTRSSP